MRPGGRSSATLVAREGRLLLYSALNMLRLHPTTITLTSSELKDVENRSRYRRYLRTQYRKSSPLRKGARQNGEALVNAPPVPEHASVDIPIRFDDVAVTTTRSTTLELHGDEDEVRMEFDTEGRHFAPSTTGSELNLPPLRSVGRGVLFHRRSVSGKAIVD